MINRNPYDRDDLKISKKDKVLEVGLGHNPTPPDRCYRRTISGIELSPLRERKAISASGDYQCERRSVTVQGQEV